MPTNRYDAAEEAPQAVLESSESTGFFMWLLITVSAGIIMAQDTWISIHQPRLGTVDATAAFTKVLVIHAIWLIVTIGFMGFTWLVRPTSAWKLHMAVGAVTVLWTIGVLVWSFSTVETLHVSTWRCATYPVESTVTEEFMESCTLADMHSSIRLGGDIFLWSADDENHWRWIVPGEGLSTLQTHWPGDVNAIYLSGNVPEAQLTAGSVDSVPGGNWSAMFNPQDTRDLRIYYIETTTQPPALPGTPPPLSVTPIDTRYLYYERFSST